MPLLIAHGMMSSMTRDMGFDWSPVASPGRQWVRYDARGHGRSTGREVAEDYAWTTLATDLLRLANYIAGPEQAIDALGVSMGCGTLLHAAVQRPERFRRLVLVIPPTAWSTRLATQKHCRAAARIVDEHGAEAFHLAQRLQLPPPVLADNGWEPSCEVRDPLLTAVLRGAALSDFPSPEQLSQLEQRTLVLAWRGDRAHPESTAEQLAAILHNATLVFAEDASSVRNWAALVSEFLL